MKKLYKVLFFLFLFLVVEAALLPLQERSTLFYRWVYRYLWQQYTSAMQKLNTKLQSDFPSKKEPRLQSKPVDRKCSQTKPDAQSSSADDAIEILAKTATFLATASDCRHLPLAKIIGDLGNWLRNACLNQVEFILIAGDGEVKCWIRYHIFYRYQSTSSLKNAVASLAKINSRPGTLLLVQVKFSAPLLSAPDYWERRDDYQISCGDRTAMIGLPRFAPGNCQDSTIIVVRKR